MKHGKKPTYEQRKVIQQFGLNPTEWLVVKDTPTEMVLVSRQDNKRTESIHKGVRT